MCGSLAHLKLKRSDKRKAVFVLLLYCSGLLVVEQVFNDLGGRLQFRPTVLVNLVYFWVL